MTPAADEWFVDGRYYTTTVFSEASGRDGLGWELEDVAPAPGRGTRTVTSACIMKLISRPG